MRPFAVAFSHFYGWFKGHVCGQENRAGDGLGTRLIMNSFVNKRVDYAYTYLEGGKGREP